MVKPYCCPSCRMHHFEQTSPDTYHCHWCGDAFAEQDVIESGNYHPFDEQVPVTPAIESAWRKHLSLLFDVVDADWIDIADKGVIRHRLE